MLIPTPPPTMPFLGTNTFEFHDICFLETLAWPPGPLLMDLKLLHCRKNARTDVFFWENIYQGDSIWPALPLARRF